jgi:hypothetical protein
MAAHGLDGEMVAATKSAAKKDVGGKAQARQQDGKSVHAERKRRKDINCRLTATNDVIFIAMIAANIVVLDNIPSPVIA